MGLSSAQMVRMSRLLDEALELDEAGQRKWLAALGVEHQDIVEALREALSLGCTGTEGDLSTLPKVGVHDETDLDAASGLKPGTRIGPYELIRPLGSGGMAEVWLARRADGAFKREVALKLPMLTRLRKDLEERFARERDILASLEHPNIARLYDAGTDSEGLPYLSMEYVAGQPITEWCDAHKLAISHRLQLMLQVLDGVQYAHERHVIHRDLKPSNILVTESAQVRLLDFGIAKLLQSEEADRTQLTSVYGRALTPDYASPELIRGHAVGARSDIYSLGVLLYELLTGARPYRLKAGASVGTLEQAITTVEVSKPSTRIEPQLCEARAVTREKLARLLRGDLDVIVLKALAKEPGERYESAASMAADLRHHLQSEAIRARPPTLSYRIRKFVRRRRIGVVVAAMAIAAILTTVGYEMHRIATEPAREIAALPAAKPLGDKSIAVLPFIDMSEKKDQEYFSDGLSEQLIDQLALVKDLKVIARTSSFYFKGKPVTIAQISKTLGAANMLEGSVRRAGNTLRVTAQLVRADSGARIWSQSYDRDVTDIFKVQDEIAGAVVRSLEISLIGGSLPESAGTQSAEAYNLYLQARSIWIHANEQVEIDRASEYLRRALNTDPEYANAWSLLSDTLSEAAYGKLPADPVKQEARRAAQQALTLNPRLPAAHLSIANIMALYDLDFRGAEAQVQQALQLDPNDSVALSEAGKQAIVFGHTNVAMDLLQRAAEIDPANPSKYYYLSWMLYETGRYPEALAASRNMLDLNPGAQENYDRLFAFISLAKGNPAAALAAIESDKRLRETCDCLVYAYDALGRKAEGDRALANLIQNHGDNGYVIARVYAHRGEVDQAFKWLDRTYQQRNYTMLWALRVDPLLKNVQADPRFNVLLRKLNLLD